MTKAEQFYNKECKRYSDIYEHLPVLKEYSSLCNHITEMGMRDIVSTWAFLMGKPDRLVSYDLEYPQPITRLAELKSAADEISVSFEFKKEDVLLADIETTDLLFIDTLHRGSQLNKELERHSEKVRKYIIMHDTTTFADKGEDNDHKPTIVNDGLSNTLDMFLETNKNWKILIVYKNNNGLTVLEKV